MDPQGRIGVRVGARALLPMILALLCGACATTRDFSSVNKLSAAPVESAAAPRNLKLVLMPPDVELSVLTAGGVTEANAAWTSAARTHLGPAISASKPLAGKQLVTYTPPPPEDPRAATLGELLLLHRAVGTAIIAHKLVVPLPSKKDTFDWSLGSDARVLRDHSGADYALFVFLRDSYSSAGRIFAQVAAAALGVGIRGGEQVGFASLVDLSNGNVVWFNFLHSPTGDLRDAAGAAGTVANLLDGMPR